MNTNKKILLADRKFLKGNPNVVYNESKIPPQAIDIEESVLGALMLEKDALTSVIEILKPNNFYKEAHQEIYTAIIDLFNNSEPIDIRTVVNQLRKRGKLEIVGGAHYIATLTTRVIAASNIEFYARSLLEYAIKRDLIFVASDIQKGAYDNTKDVFELLDHSEQALFDVTNSNIRKNYKDMGSLLIEAFREIETRKDHKNCITGVPSGFAALDKVTSGWQKSDLIIIAARPGMGKTAFALSALRNAAVQYNNSVAFFSLEMSSLQLINRLISSEAELESEKIKKGNIEQYEWEQMMHKTSVLSKASIFIDDTPALSMFELRAKCRRLKSKHGIQLVVVDYLQLMSGDSIRNAGNREQEIAHISRSLKNLAKELDIPVIALSQLSRAVEVRGGDKRPQLSDLRESGSIEQDADLVLLLYRPEYYGIMEEDGIRNLAEVIMAKHRNGPLENVNVRYISKYTKFVDVEDSCDNLSNISEDVITHYSKANIDLF